MIRKKLDLQEEEEKAFYLLVKGKYTITGDVSLTQIFQNHKNPDDGFLYIVYKRI